MSAVEERSAAAAPAAGMAYYPWLLIGLLWTAAFLTLGLDLAASALYGSATLSPTRRTILETRLIEDGGR